MMKQDQLNMTIEDRIRKTAKRDSKGQDRKTRANKKVAGELLIQTIKKYTSFAMMNEVADLDEDAEEEVADALLAAIQKAIKVNSPVNWGGKKSTIKTRLGNARRILHLAGFPAYVVKTLKNAQDEHVKASGVNITEVEFVPTLNDCIKLMKTIESVKAGDVQLEYLGTPMSDEKTRQAVAYALIAMPYAVRAGTGRLVQYEHYNDANITLWIAKKTGADPLPMMRKMNNVTNEALAYWAKIAPTTTGSIWTNKSDVPKWAGQILKAAGLPTPNGKYGFHSFRHCFATWCFNNGIPMEVAAAALGHKDSKTTERSYVALSAKQQKGSEAIEQFQQAMFGMVASIGKVGKTMKHFAERINRTVSWSQKNVDHFLQDDQKDTLRFLLESGVNPAAAAVYTIDKVQGGDCTAEIVSLGFEPRSAGPEPTMMDRYTKRLAIKGQRPFILQVNGV